MESKLEAEERNEVHLPPGPRASPWLVYSHGKGKKYHTFFNLCNGKTYRKCIPELSRKSFWMSSSSQGWLIVLCDDVSDDTHYSNSEKKDTHCSNSYKKDTHYSNSDKKDTHCSNSSKCKFGDCFLWNPASLEMIQLPTMFHLIREGAKYHITDSVMSSSPSSPDGNSIVFFIFVGNESPEYVLVFCRPGVDKVWRMQELPMIKSFRTTFCFKGKLYISCLPSDLRPDDLPTRQLIEVEVPGVGDDEPVIRSFNANLKITSRIGWISPICEYFVDSCDEVFRVVLLFHPLLCRKEVFAIEIFRLDFSSMAWVAVKSLADHVIFLSEHTSMSCSATEMGLTRGCVYFTLDEDMSLYKFDLEGDSISVSLPCPDLPTPWQSPDWIMITTLIRVADGRRKTEDVLNDEEEPILIEAVESKCIINVEEKEEEESHKNGKSELKKSGSPDILDDSMVKLIASYLHPIDHIHFRAVSKAIRSKIAIVNWRTASTDTIHATSLSPWLVFKEKVGPIYNFTDPMHGNEKYLMNLSELPLDAKIRFSMGGWLLMSSGRKTLFFFNPFTRVRIQLPDLPSTYEYVFYGISFSSLPTSSDCLVFAITDLGPKTVFIFYISRGDASWNCRIVRNTRFPSNGRLMEFIPWFNTPVFHNRGFYCLDYTGTLGLFDVQDQFSWKVLAKPDRPCSSVYQSFLVECEGKLLSVFLGHIGSRVWIFRLDFSKKVWVKVKSLGKHMLFISHTSCFSAVAPRSCMENKIYFPKFHGEGILFYSLATGRYHSVGSPHSAQDFYDTKEQLNCSWIEPNWSRTTVQELDWLNV